MEGGVGGGVFGIVPATTHVGVTRHIVSCELR